MENTSNKIIFAIGLLLMVVSRIGLAQQSVDATGQANSAAAYCNRVKSSAFVEQYNRDVQRLGGMFDPSPSNYIANIKKVDEKYFSGYVDNFLDDDNGALSEKLKVFLDKYPEQYQNDKVASRYLKGIMLASTLKNARACAESTQMNIFKEQPLSGQSDVSKLLTDWLLWEKINGLLNWHNASKQSKQADPKAGLDQADGIFDQLDKMGALTSRRLSKRVASYLVFGFKGSDALLSKIERQHVSAFEEKFAALKVEAVADTKRRKQEEQSAQAKREYENSPDGVLQVAYGAFIIVERCFQVRQGYVDVYVSDPEYQRSRGAIKAIESTLKPSLKQATTKLWDQAASNTKFTAKPNLFYADSLIPGVCHSNVSELETIRMKLEGRKSPLKSF